MQVNSTHSGPGLCDGVWMRDRTRDCGQRCIRSIVSVYNAYHHPSRCSTDLPYLLPADSLPVQSGYEHLAMHEPVNHTRSPTQLPLPVHSQHNADSQSHKARSGRYLERRAVALFALQAWLSALRPLFCLQPAPANTSIAWPQFLHANETG